MTGTFEGVGTLQFTPDNKHAYIYSGSLLNGSGAGAADQTILLFRNNSEYY